MSYFDIKKDLAVASAQFHPCTSIAFVLHHGSFISSKIIIILYTHLSTVYQYSTWFYLFYYNVIPSLASESVQFYAVGKRLITIHSNSQS